MASLQRRRGGVAVFHLVEQRTDHRGNVVSAPTGATVSARAVAIPDRSARAEVPGQMQIDVTKLIMKAEIPGVDLWSRVEWHGRWWDVVSPPTLHTGTRHTRHWSITMRARVDAGGIPLVGWED